MITDQPPRRRPHRAGHGSVYDIRRASGLRLAERISLQTRRDDLVHDLARIDAQLLTLSEERQEVVAELRTLRQALYPPIPWSHGRRPPDLDAAPLPPAPADATTLVGRSLRAACRQILRRHGATSLRDLHGLLHRYGYVVGSRRPVAALSDAMRHEVRVGRAARVERGVYQLTTSRRRPRAERWPELAPETLLARYRASGPTPLDPDLDEDPTTWGYGPAPDPPDPDGVPPGGPHNLRHHGRC